MQKQTFLFQAFLSGPFTTWKWSRSLSSKSFVTESMKFQNLACKETGQAQQKKVDMWNKKDFIKNQAGFHGSDVGFVFCSQKNIVTVTCINCDQVTPNGFTKGSFATMDRCSAAFSERVSSELPTCWHHRTQKLILWTTCCQIETWSFVFQTNKKRPWKSFTVSAFFHSLGLSLNWAMSRHKRKAKSTWLEPRISFPDLVVGVYGYMQMAVFPVFGAGKFLLSKQNCGGSS